MDITEQLIKKADIAQKTNKYEKAIIFYTQALEFSPANPTIYKGRAQAFTKLGKYSLALDDANKLLRMNPHSPEFLVLKGHLYMCVEQYAYALLCLYKVQRLDPGNAMLERLISQAERKLYKKNKALRQKPWLGAGIGIVLGVVFVIRNFINNENQYLKPFPMTMVIILSAVTGYLAARLHTYIKKKKWSALLYS